MAEWEAKMKQIEEYEITNLDDNNKIIRDNTGPKYKFEDICNSFESTYTFGFVPAGPLNGGTCEWD